VHLVFHRQQLAKRLHSWSTKRSFATGSLGSAPLRAPCPVPKSSGGGVRQIRRCET
jgi:hypothetical protein